MWIVTAHPSQVRNTPMTTTSPLRRRMIENMTIRNLSRPPQQSYI
jgi:hypothetical protein